MVVLAAIKENGNGSRRIKILRKEKDVVIFDRLWGVFRNGREMTTTTKRGF